MTMDHINEPLERVRAAVRALDSEEQLLFAEFVARAIAVVVTGAVATYGEDDAAADKLPALNRVLEKLQKAAEGAKVES
jgi:hypothetical protein